MAKIKPLPCVQSGYCCSIAPCVYGRRMTEDEKDARQYDCMVGEPKTIDTECVHLALPDRTGQRKCLIYDEIKEAEEMSSEVYPMMGSGCSSTLFNEVRTQIINNMEITNGQENKVLHEEES